MFKMLRNVRILPLIATGFLFFALTGCPASPASTGGGGGGGGTGNSTNAILPWTVIVYLDADNNLEAAGLQDINEMEAGLTNDNIYLLVLVDRVNGYDSSDGDWKGTRLYRVRYDTNGLDATIRSERLAAGINGINLTASGDLEELNMADPNTLAGFIAYCQTNYPASNYMVILWNHGDGWRSKTDLPFSPNGTLSALSKTDNIPVIAAKGKAVFLPETAPDWTGIFSNTGISGDYTSDGSKGICVDSTSANDVLYNSEVRTVLTGKGIKVLGFDACLMSMIESAYEFRGAADYLIASADSEPGDGWEYNDWVSRFIASPMTAGDLITNVIVTYSNRYVSTATTTMAAVDLSKMNALLTAFNGYVDALTNQIWNTSHSNYALVQIAGIFSNVERYITPTTGGNVHLDIFDLADKVPFSASSALKTALTNAVFFEWHNASGTINTGNPNARGMALYFGTFADASLNVGLRNDYAFSNFTLFNQNSYWDGYLTDLYSFPAYIWIGTNQSQSGSMTSNSSVVYQFYVASTGNLTIDLSPPAGCDDDVYLIHTNAVMARSYSGSYGVHERISYNAAARGWYLVMVNRYSATSYTVTNQSYSLVVSNQGAGIR